MGLLDGKNIVVTGVLTDASLAFAVARRRPGRGRRRSCSPAPAAALSLTTAHGAQARRASVDVLELDVTVARAPRRRVRDAVAERWGRVDGVMHAIAYGPPTTLGEDFMGAPVGRRRRRRPRVGVLAEGAGRRVRAADDAGRGVRRPRLRQPLAWPAYNWMGVAKSALQSVSRYLAKELGPQGIRCNLVAAGPVRTMAAKSIPGFAKFEDMWDERAPLGWDINDPEPVAQRLRRPAVGLVPRHHRRDRPRRRRVPRRRGVGPGRRRSRR